MVNLKNNRKLKAAVLLICEKLQINDKELDAYVEKGTVKPIKPVKK